MSGVRHPTLLGDAFTLPQSSCLIYMTDLEYYGEYPVQGGCPEIPTGLVGRLQVILDASGNSGLLDIAFDDWFESGS